MSTLNRRTVLGVIVGWPLVAMGQDGPPVKAPTDLKVLDGPVLPPLPAGAIARLGSPTMRVPGWVSAVRFSANTNVLLAAESDELRAWDPATGKLLFRLGYPKDFSANSGVLTSDDTLALLVRPSSGGKYEVHHYAFRTGKLLHRSKPLGQENVEQTDLTQDGRLLVIADNQRVCVYDAKSGDEKWQTDLNNQRVNSVQFTADGQQLLFTKRDEVRRFTATEGKELPVLRLNKAKNKRGENILLRIAVDQTGRYVACSVGDEDIRVVVWDAKTEKQLQVFKTSEPLGFLPDGSLVTTQDGLATVWNSRTGARIRDINIPIHRTAQLSPDGRWIGSYASDAAILIDVTTGKLASHTSEPPGRPRHLCFASKNELRGNLPDWGGWVTWDIGTGQTRLRTASAHRDKTAQGFSRDGKIGLVSKESAHAVLEIATGKVLHESIQDMERHNSDAVSMTLSSDGRWAFASNGDGLAVVELATAKRTVVPHRQSDISKTNVYVDRPANAPFASIANVREEQGVVDIYDVQAQRWLRRLAVNHDIAKTTWADDGRTLAVLHRVNHDNGSSRMLVSVFDLATGQRTFQTAIDDSSEPAIRLSADGRLLARAETKERIVVDEVGVGVRIEFSAGKHIDCFAFSLDTRTLASSQSHGPIVLWNLYPLTKTPNPDRMSFNRGWDELRTDDAKNAFAIITKFLSHPKPALTYLRDILPPTPDTDQAHIADCIRDLDHAQYRRRELAYKSLQELGDRATHQVREALTQHPSPEARERLERLLRTETNLSPDQRRVLRAIEIVERIGTTDAIELLTHWGSGTKNTFLTREAQAANARLLALGK